MKPCNADNGVQIAAIIAATSSPGLVEVHAKSIVHQATVVDKIIIHTADSLRTTCLRSMKSHITAARHSHLSDNLLRCSI